MEATGDLVSCVTLSHTLNLVQILICFFHMNRFGHLVDIYAWNPHCRYLDGLGPSGTSRTRECYILTHKANNNIAVPYNYHMI